MGSKPNTTPLVVIVGETASGKSALSLSLAQRFNGEIIAADSRTVYKGMDIGTAKPTAEEQALVPHHLLDVVTPAQPFSAADFKRRTEEAIADIDGRGKLPFLVGGTGLYIDAVIYNFSFLQKGDETLRDQLANLDIATLQDMLREQGIALPTNERNPRHLIRALEAQGATPEHHILRGNTLLLGLRIDREVLRAKVVSRIDQMVAQGLVQEVERVGRRYGWDAPALQAPGYKAFREFILGNITLEQAKQQFAQNDMQLAKRQRTWFKRNKSIHWISKEEEAVDLITTLLSK